MEETLGQTVELEPPFCVESEFVAGPKPEMCIQFLTAGLRQATQHDWWWREWELIKEQAPPEHSRKVEDLFNTSRSSFLMVNRRSDTPFGLVGFFNVNLFAQSSVYRYELKCFDEFFEPASEAASSPEALKGLDDCSKYENEYFSNLFCQYYTSCPRLSLADIVTDFIHCNMNDLRKELLHSGMSHEVIILDHFLLIDFHRADAVTYECDYWVVPPIQH